MGRKCFQHLGRKGRLLYLAGDCRLPLFQAGGKEESAQGVGINVAELDAAVSFAKEYLSSKSN